MNSWESLCSLWRSKVEYSKSFVSGKEKSFRDKIDMKIPPCLNIQFINLNELFARIYIIWCVWNYNAILSCHRDKLMIIILNVLEILWHTLIPNLWDDLVWNSFLMGEVSDNWKIKFRMNDYYAVSNHAKEYGCKIHSLKSVHFVCQVSFYLARQLVNQGAG